LPNKDLDVRTHTDNYFWLYNLAERWTSDGEHLAAVTTKLLREAPRLARNDAKWIARRAEKSVRYGRLIAGRPWPIPERQRGPEELRHLWSQPSRRRAA